MSHESTPVQPVHSAEAPDPKRASITAAPDRRSPRNGKGNNRGATLPGPMMTPSRPSSNPAGSIGALVQSAIGKLAVLCVLLALMGASESPPKTKILTCKDSNGRTLITDPADPRCYKPPPTEDQRVADEEHRRKNKETYLACKAEQRSDQSLVSRYPDQARHDAARQQALDGVAAAMRASDTRIKRLADDRKHLLEEAEFYPDGKLPPKLKRDLDTNGALLEAQRQAAAKQRENAAQINSFYDEELKKLKTLWAPQSERRNCVAPDN